MKKFRKIMIPILILVMFFCCVPKTEYATEISMKIGDINGDGVIDSRDTLRILEHIAASTIPQIKQKHAEWILTEEGINQADINQDGIIDSRDTLRELEYIAASTIPTIAQKHPDWKAYIENKWENIEVTEISLDRTSIKLEEGSTTKLMATILPENATNKIVTWSSSDSNVATVDGIGNVTGQKAGIAIITAKALNGVYKTCQIEVTNKEEIVIDPTIETLKSSNSKTIKSTYSSNKTVEIPSTPQGINVGSITGQTKVVSKKQTGIVLKQKDCTVPVGTSLQLNATTSTANKNITWSSSNSSIATVNKNGLVKGIKVGKVAITAKASNNEKATCIIRVNIPPKSISLNKTSLIINKGSRSTLTVNFNPTNTSSKEVNWKSSNPNVVSVSNATTTNGMITIIAKAKGTATITATHKYGKTATCKIIVNELIKDIKFNTIAYSYVSHDKKVSTDDKYTLVNTAEHFNYCGQQSSYTSLKCDIRPTKDGGLILCHDAGFTLDNTKKIIDYNSNNKNTVLIHNLTTQQCLALQHKNTFNGKVCKVTDFETFLKICKKYNKYPFITIRDEYIDVIIPKVLKLLEKYDLKYNSIINSFSYNTLKAFREKDKNIMLSYVVSSYNNNIGFKKAHVDEANKLKNCIVSIFIFNGYITRDESFKKINQFSSVISYAKSKNVKVYAAIDPVDDRNKLYQYGISGCQFRGKINN